METEFRNAEAALSFRHNFVADASVFKRRITEDAYLTLGDIRDETTLLMEKLNITKGDVNLIFTSPALLKLLSDSDRKRRLVLIKKLRNRNMNLKKAVEYLRNERVFDFSV